MQNVDTDQEAVYLGSSFADAVNCVILDYPLSFSRFKFSYLQNEEQWGEGEETKRKLRILLQTNMEQCMRMKEEILLQKALGPRNFLLGQMYLLYLS